MKCIVQHRRRNHQASSYLAQDSPGGVVVAGGLPPLEDLPGAVLLPPDGEAPLVGVAGGGGGQVEHARGVGLRLIQILARRLEHEPVGRVPEHVRGPEPLVIQVGPVTCKACRHVQKLLSLSECKEEFDWNE